MRHDDQASVDSEIAAALARVSDEDWMALWEAVDALGEATSFATWAGGDIVGTTMIEGEERPTYQMPYPVYHPPVELVRSRLGKLGLMVPFDWMDWDGIRRYQEDHVALESAPVSDAVRLLTAIQRAERFGDGNIEGALKSGLMQAALARLRRWYEQDRTADTPGPG